MTPSSYVLGQGSYPVVEHRPPHPICPLEVPVRALNLLIVGLLASCTPADEGEDDKPEDSGSESESASDDVDGDGHSTEVDCDDEDADVHPGAVEACNGRDDDCDGVTDDAEDAPTWYLDHDRDGYGDPTWADQGCEAATGYVAEGGDCDDDDSALHPGADETCDGIDNDCDGSTDEEPVDGTTWYEDADEDGYGNPESTSSACERAEGWVANPDDDDDTDPDTPGVLNGDWPQLGGAPGHGGEQLGSIGDKRLAEVWSVAVAESLNAPVVAGQVVYVSAGSYFDAQGPVSAYDANTGAELWTYPLPADAFSVNPPSYDDGRVFVQRGNHGDDTHLWCFDAADGTVLWRAEHTAQWEQYLAPTVADGGVYVNGGYYGGMYGFDGENGDQLFFASLEQYDQWTPAWADGVVYTFVEGNLRAHHPSTGIVEWSIDLGWNWSGWSMTTAPVVVDGVAYLATGEGLFAVDLDGEALLWQADGAFSGLPAVSGGSVYVLADDAVERFAVADGAAEAIYIASDTLLDQPILTDDVLIVASMDATMVFDLESRAVIDEVPRGGHLAVGNGKLFVGDPDGALYVYRWE